MKIASLGIVGASVLWVSVVSAQDVQSVATVREVMLDLVMPSSDAVFNVAVEPPADDEAWTALAREARILAESGNLLMVGDRVRDTGEWMRMARAQVDAAVETLEAIQARDLDALTTAGDSVYETCVNCHGQYLEQ